MFRRMVKKGYVLGGGGFLADGKQQYVLALLNLDTESPQAETIPLSFLGHGIVFSPQDRFRAAVFEKKGPGACLVDLRERCVLRPIPTPTSRRFYGHGAYSADGCLLYATESLIEDDFAGVLSVRDAESLHELGCVPTHGASPHDCLLIDEGKTLVVSNGGGPKDGGAQPCVCYIELSTGKLLDKVVLDSPLHNTGHLALSRRGDLAVISAPRDGLPSPNEQLGALSLRPLGGQVQTVKKPGSVVERMRGETLSLTILETQRIVVATNPFGNLVSMWHLTDATFVGKLELLGPRGVCQSLDAEWLLVSHVVGSSVALTAYTTARRKPVGWTVQPSYMSGSHIICHDLTAG
jgi:hypothetical protein